MLGNDPIVSEIRSWPTVTSTTPVTFLHIERDDFRTLKATAPAAHRLFVEYVEERVAALSA